MFQTMIVAALVAVGQTPKPAVPPPPAAPKDPLADAVTRALQSHPDIRVAEAEVQVAQAKLAQAKLKIAQQVTAAHADRDRLRAVAQVASQTFAHMKKLLDRGLGSQSEFAAAETASVTSQANLAKAEADYNALVGPADPVVSSFWLQSAALGDMPIYLDYSLPVRTRLKIAVTPPVAPGSPAEKLKLALDKPVKFGGAPGIGLKAGYEAVLKPAGVDVHLRVPSREDPDQYKDVFRLQLPAGEYPLGTWFELIADAYAQAAAEDQPKRYELYLREYGLLVSDPKLAPPGAVMVSDLWKQLRAEKAAKK